METEPVFFNRQMETLSPEEMQVLQWERIRRRLSYLSENSPFYRKKFEEAGLEPEDIRELNDFKQRVPFTTKDALQAERERLKDPYAGLRCVPSEEIIHLVRTGGTTGVPTVYGLTERDLQTLGEWTARLWYQIGGRRGHTVAVATMGCWNPFSVSLVEGLRAGGIRRYQYTMPAPGEEVFPFEVLPKWMDVEGIYLSARPLWQVTKKYGTRLRELLPKLRYVLVAGQHVTSSFRKGMEFLWGARLYDAYTMTDACLPAANCPMQTATFHFPDDAFLVEIIDPETGKDFTGTGKVGEIVVSSLVLEGTPLLRFRSEDLGFTVSERCACGRTGIRLGVVERLAHAVTVGEKPVLSSQVEEVIYGIPELFLKQYYLVKKRIQPQERLLLRVEQPDDPAQEPRLREELSKRLLDALGVPSEIAFVSEGDERYVALYKFLKVVPE